MGLMGCPETSVMNYHYTLRNSPEECSYHPIRVKSDSKVFSCSYVSLLRIAALGLLCDLS